jgi:hypothetical protein
MTTSTLSVNKKARKKMGRPATGHDPVVAARIPIEVIRQIQRWAKANKCSRSAAITALVKRGLKDGEE